MWGPEHGDLRVLVKESGFNSKGTGMQLRDLNKGMTDYFIFLNCFSVYNWSGEWMKAIKNWNCSEDC